MKLQDVDRATLNRNGVRMILPMHPFTDGTHFGIAVLHNGTFRPYARSASGFVVNSRDDVTLDSQPLDEMIKDVFLRVANKADPENSQPISFFLGMLCRSYTDVLEAAKNEAAYHLHPSFTGRDFELGVAEFVDERLAPYVGVRIEGKDKPVLFFYPFRASVAECLGELLHYFGADPTLGAWLERAIKTVENSN